MPLLAIAILLGAVVKQGVEADRRIEDHSLGNLITQFTVGLKLLFIEKLVAGALVGERWVGTLVTFESQAESLNHRRL